MNRREFLNSAIGNGAKVTALVTTAAAATSRRVDEVVAPGRERFQAYVDALEKRMDKMERRHRRLAKATLIVAGVSTGLDLSLML